MVAGLERLEEIEAEPALGRVEREGLVGYRIDKGEFRERALFSPAIVIWLMAIVNWLTMILQLDVRAR